MSLALSVLGLVLVCLPIVGPRYTVEFSTWWLPQIVAGYLGMILVIEVVGVPLRSVLTNFWAGALFAFGLFLVGGLAGSTASMVIYQDYDPFSYVVKPLYWLVIYGCLPAIIIGIVGSTILRASAKKQGESGSLGESNP